ncbi:uncharacterized protein [Populus alba]|uniref:uncharacterized protein n=1 Tax=Populus alba TaxID=43335 RepID=UPI003CC73E97
MRGKKSLPGAEEVVPCWGSEKEEEGERERGRTTWHGGGLAEDDGVQLVVAVVEAGVGYWRKKKSCRSERNTGFWKEKRERVVEAVWWPVGGRNEQAKDLMGINKERIEQLKEGLHRMELGMADKLQHLEDTLNRLSDVLLANQEPPNQTNQQQLQKVSLASYHLEGEANQWWQWVRRLTEEEGRVLSWVNFEEELGARFGPSECEDFDESLSKIRQGGSLRDYQCEFECLGNRVRGWTQKALVGHKCREPRILMLEGYDDSNTLLCDKEGDDQAFQENAETITEPEITLHALTGWAAPKTMRITARIGLSDVIALIDSGSTHNFISERLANALRIPVVPTTSFTVRVANGLDLVLGIQWLEMLGFVVCNWKQLTMEFQWNNQLMLLRGMGDEGIQLASISELTKAIHQHNAIFAIYILKEPTGLPPARGVDHCISLKDGTEPINVRQYRYAYYQKEEIEKQVQEMLNSGLIRHNTNPFSSSVLLVKKKDGTWRFCTDYRALNAATVKDRFPIPTVDDMLDELYGASYFTKLDLRAGYHQTFDILHQHQFFVKANECAFGKQELEYLGHIITNHGVKEAETAFLTLKQAMTTTPTLAMPNFKDVFTVETDASGDGIGAILSQQGKPIAFMSKALGVAKKSWSTYAKKMLAILEAIRLWPPYLLG